MPVTEPRSGSIGRARAPRQTPRPVLLRAGTVALRVVGWVVLLAVAAVLVASVVLPRAVGGQAYTVLSGSMTPTYAIGSLVVVRPVDPSEVLIGQVITYQLRPGEPTVVTHRVIGSRMLNGERAFLTRGDANPVPDADPVRAVQVRGVVWYAVPGLGYVNHLLGGQVRAVLLPVAVVALLCYAVTMFVGHGRDRRRRAVAPRRASEVGS